MTPTIPTAPVVDDDGVVADDDGYGIGDEIARSRNPLGVVGTPPCASSLKCLKIKQNYIHPRICLFFTLLYS